MPIGTGLPAIHVSAAVRAVVVFLDEELSMFSAGCLQERQGWSSVSSVFEVKL